MRRPFRRLALAAALAAGALAGCQHSAVQTKQPPDPLLVTKKPVEGKPRSPEDDLSARVQPPAPPIPTSDFAGSPRPDPSQPVRHVQLRIEPLSPTTDGPP
jgi:hypothetical protein